MDHFDHFLQDLRFDQCLDQVARHRELLDELWRTAVGETPGQNTGQTPGEIDGQMLWVVDPPDPPAEEEVMAEAAKAMLGEATVAGEIKAEEEVAPEGNDEEEMAQEELAKAAEDDGEKEEEVVASAAAAEEEGWGQGDGWPVGALGRLAGAAHWDRGQGGGRRWGRLGFQRDEAPQSDFRSVGALGLHCLVTHARKHPGVVRCV